MRCTENKQGRIFSGGPLILLPVIFLVAAFIATCGGGSSFIGGGIGGTAGVSQGVITGFGSIFVGGRELQKKGTSEVEIDDVSGLDETDLKLGMVVKVRGTFDDDGVNGEYDKVEAENEVQGDITGFGPSPNEFTVLAQDIIVDGNTAFANVADLSGLTIGDTVEVHGFRDDPLNNGTIRATRVELLTGSPLDHEVKGVITGKNIPTGTFNIGLLEVNYLIRNPVIDPFGSTFENGDPVEVTGVFNDVSNQFEATRIEREDLEDAEFEPGEDEDFEVEGFVTGFTVLTSDFFVNGTRVRLDGSVKYEGGVSTDLADGIKIEAEGHAFNDPVFGLLLLADEIKFKESIRMEASAASVTAATATEATVYNKTVLIVTGITDDSGYSANPSSGLRIRGFQNADGTITATRIEDRSVSAGNEELQGPIKSPNEAADTFTIIGIMVNTAGAEFRDDDDAVLTKSLFYGQLVEDKTVVKARGDFSTSPDMITANRVEIE